MKKINASRSRSEKIPSHFGDLEYKKIVARLITVHVRQEVATRYKEQRCAISSTII